MRRDFERRLARLAPKRALRSERYVFVTGPTREECSAEIERMKTTGEAAHDDFFLSHEEAGPTRSEIVDMPAGTLAQILREIDGEGPPIKSRAGFLTKGIQPAILERTLSPWHQRQDGCRQDGDNDLLCDGIAAFPGHLPCRWKLAARHRCGRSQRVARSGMKTAEKTAKLIGYQLVY
jgi:hypothetical protein